MKLIYSFFVLMFIFGTWGEFLLAVSAGTAVWYATVVVLNYLNDKMNDLNHIAVSPTKRDTTQSSSSTVVGEFKAL